MIIWRGKTSFRIKRNIDIKSKTTTFIGKDTGEYAIQQANSLKKINMSKLWQTTLGSIPSIGNVKGTKEEVVKAYIDQVALGSIPVVVGSSEAFNPANWKNKDVLFEFANYNDTPNDIYKDGNGYLGNYNYHTEHKVGNWYYYEIYWYHGL